MTETDWIKRLHRKKTIDEFEIRLLKEWLEGQGDKRSEEIAKCLVLHKDKNIVHFKLPGGKESWTHYGDWDARSQQAAAILEYLLNTDA